MLIEGMKEKGRGQEVRQNVADRRIAYWKGSGGRIG